MSERRSDCPDCKRPMQPIKLIDATEGPGLRDEGSRHVELSYTVPQAKPSFFMGKIERLGVVKGLICPDCGRILLYGERAP